MAITNREKGLFNDAPRLPGEIPQMHDGVNVVTYSAKDDILFGQGVEKGANSDEGKLFAGAGSEFVGIATKSKDASKADSSDIIEGYEADNDMGVIQEGLIAVTVIEAVDIGDPVRCFHTGVNQGNFGTSASAGNTALIGGAKFKSKTAGAGVAIVELGGFTAFTVTDDV
jgi:hypothetical protein